MHHLHQAVNPSIGAARTGCADFFSSKAAQGRFELVLYGVAAGLALPALVAAAVVADP